MKLKYIYRGLVCSLTLAVAACSLDYEPLDTYSDITEGFVENEKEIVFKDKAAVQSHMETIYRTFRDRQEHWYVDVLLIAEAHSDNAYAGTTGAEVVPYETNSIEGSNSVLDRDWNRYLEDVAKANKLICNVDTVSDTSLTVAEREQYKAESKIFRSMIWFDMVRLWGDIPLITTVASDITAENIEEVYPAYFPAQSSELEVYQQIEKDLLEAMNCQYLASTTTDKTKYSKSVARALLAKIYAEKPLRDYSKVIKYCDELADSGFDLVNDFSDLFGVTAGNDAKVRNTQESIFEAQFFTGSGNWCTWMFGRNLANWDESFTWAKWVTPSRDLIKLYQTEGDEIRFKESIVYYECGWSNYYPNTNYPFMYKCRSAYSSIIKYRYADLLLLKAEALIMKSSSDLNAAADIIDKVRTRAGLAKLPSDTRGSKDSMLEALLKERRMELAFEGQRWFDLVRLDKVESVMNAVYKKDSGRHAQKATFNEFSYRLPLPQKVLDQNPNLKQNPGY